MALTPSFDITSEPRQLGIRGTIDGVEVTRASFKECDDPYRRELIQIDTAPEHQRGMATPSRCCGTVSRRSREVR